MLLTPTHLVVCVWVHARGTHRYIAVEFAGIFRGLGAEVHLMYRGDKPLRGCVIVCVTCVC